MEIHTSNNKTRAGFYGALAEMWPDLIKKAKEGKVYPLSDPKSQLCLYSVLITVSLVCGVYFIGGAWLGKDLIRTFSRRSSKPPEINHAVAQDFHDQEEAGEEAEAEQADFVY
ncbi:hypothetical protein CASFOL_000207 [Castilleja foliolosa]|uniref:Uncharacterized protein n=1 Tax=Castilleja foliolosa TaxID=1961234 RepID=A0ABD3ERF0_9LAMI